MEAHQYKVPQDAEIVKIQQSLHSSDEVKRVLVYNKARTLFFESGGSDIVRSVSEKLKERPKGYFRAKLISDKLTIYDEVKDQGW